MVSGGCWEHRDDFFFGVAAVRVGARDFFFLLLLFVLGLCQHVWVCATVRRVSHHPSQCIRSARLSVRCGLGCEKSTSHCFFFQMNASMDLSSPTGAHKRIGRLTSKVHDHLERWDSEEKYLAPFLEKKISLDSDNEFHAGVNLKRDRRQLGFRRMPFSVLLNQLNNEQFDFVHEKWTIGQPVKPFLCFKSEDGKIALHYFEMVLKEIGEVCPELRCSIDHVVILKLERTETSRQAEVAEYRMIWNSGKHFASVHALGLYLEPFKQSMEQFRIDPYVYQLTGDFLTVGSMYRYEWENPTSELSKRGENFLYEDRTPPAFVPLHPDDLDLENFDIFALKACMVTSIQPNSIEVRVNLADRVDMRPVRFGEDPRAMAALELAKGWCEGIVLTQVSRKAQSQNLICEFGVPNFTGVRCYAGVSHRDRKLVCEITPLGVATFQCLGRGDLEEGCPGRHVCGITKEGEAHRRWEATFEFIMRHQLDNITFPLTRSQWGRYNLDPREFYTKLCHQSGDTLFDFDRDFGDHPMPQIISQMPWDPKIVDRFMNSPMGVGPGAVSYFNLFLLIDTSGGRSGNIWVRSFGGSFYNKQSEASVRRLSMDNVIYYEEDEKTGKKNKKRLFFDYWMQYTRQRHGFLDRKRFEMTLSFSRDVPNMMPPSQTDLHECRLRYRALNLAEKNWLWSIWTSTLHCLTALESEQNRLFCREWFCKWFTRMIFHVGEHHKVAVGLYSPSGGCGKSTIGDFITRVLGNHLCCFGDLKTIVTSRFNLDFNVPFVFCDDKAPAPSSAKENQIMIGKIKNFITSSEFSGAVKHGSESETQKKICNLFITSNHGFPGINHEGRERRFFLCEMLSEADQAGYFQNEGAYECDACGRCNHSYNTVDEFWKQIWHKDIIGKDPQNPGLFFHEFVGMLYERVYLEFHSSDDLREKPLLLQCPPCRLVTENQIQQAPLEERWYREVVLRKFVINFRDLYAYKEILLVQKNDPNTAKGNLPVFPIRTLFQSFQKFTRDEQNYKMSITVFTQDIIQVIQARAPKGVTVAIINRDCEAWYVDEFDKSSWRKRPIGAVTMECLPVYYSKRTDVHAANLNFTVKDRHKSTSNLNFDDVLSSSSMMIDDDEDKEEQPSILKNLMRAAVFRADDAARDEFADMPGYLHGELSEHSDEEANTRKAARHDLEADENDRARKNSKVAHFVDAEVVEDDSMSLSLSLEKSDE